MCMLVEFTAALTICILLDHFIPIEGRRVGVCNTNLILLVELTRNPARIVGIERNTQVKQSVAVYWQEQAVPTPRVGAFRRLFPATLAVLSYSHRCTLPHPASSMHKQKNGYENQQRFSKSATCKSSSTVCESLECDQYGKNPTHSVPRPSFTSCSSLWTPKSRNKFSVAMLWRVRPKVREDGA